MIFPSADTIEDKIGSRYSLVVIAAKRAKQIKEGAPVLIDTASTNPLTIALEEIAAGKVGIAEGQVVTKAPSDEETALSILGGGSSIPATDNFAESVLRDEDEEDSANISDGTAVA